MRSIEEPVNVLIVDDHEDSLFAMRAALEPLGESLVLCSTGEQALRELLKREFAVIILDVRLPGMDGFDIASTIRERPSLSNTPIIFLTGLSHGEPHISRGYSLGAVDYLIKPIDARILRAKVHVFVDLFKKTEEVRRQTEQIFLLREREREQQRERERLATEQKILLKEKEAAEALARQSAELKRSNDELKQFAYLASHDLQEPLRTMTSFCDLLESECKGKMSADADDYLHFITDAAKRMRTLIKGLLDYTRIGKSETREKVDCGELVEEVLSDLATCIQESDARIAVGKLPALMANASELRALFQNLISNAIKFRRMDVEPEISVSAVRSGDEWIFSVQDNGIGIEEQHDRRIFDMFQRGQSIGGYEGTGIGLAHCRKIVELCGGRIWVESKLGHGSRFQFSLPIRRLRLPKHDQERNTASAR